ncbi:hypothetical protein TRFO_28662 [Tritrichomonas foetus]|uniref:Uncharacterized protein n=1 Tax=Tritrichomonas foetus TaxID=1144522 RepID=A0A1J4K2H5_9EUKA|nr:hypothetical protein TRFO_28662 [Tritrichomonas foetus]|eukprot:OHT03948.1 hypothetical protein TRFO_28662 [Tritrichomonas foetus]
MSSSKKKTTSSLSKKSAPLTLEEHEEIKQKKLQSLKKQALHDRKLFDELGNRVRKEQAAKGKALIQGNPLAVDQASRYEKEKARLQDKYIFNP